MKNRIQLSDHFTVPRLLLFALPSIGMQLVDNTYQVADGYFISNYIGDTAFGAENLIFPVLLIVMSVGLMFGSGASALLAREMGEGRREDASRLMTMLIAALSVLGVLLSAALYLLMPAVARWVGASEVMMEYCVPYARVLCLFMPFQMLSMSFHPLLITAERPGLGLAVTIINAAVNILLDWAFVAGLGWGMRGAAVATGLAWLVSAVIPFVFFLRNRDGLHFGRLRVDLKALGQTIYNGASEMVDAVAYAVVAVIFNLQLIRYLGDAGVEAYAVGEYVGGLFSAVFYGISMSIVPVAGYHLGQSHKKELHSLWHKGMLLMAALGLATTLLSRLLAEPLSRVFVGYNESLTALSVHALRLTSLMFLAAGMTVYAGSYFTGVSQGTVSLLIAVVKGIAGPLLMIWLLPPLLGADGLWLAAPFAELLALLTVAVSILWWWRSGEDKHLGEVAEETEES